MGYGFVGIAGVAAARPAAGVRRRSRALTCAAEPNDRAAQAAPNSPPSNVKRFNSEEEVTKTVEKLYDAYPFPPDPLIDEAPIGYNWRWHYPTAHSFCTHASPPSKRIRILDAGCGTGCSTEYLVYMNPEAEVVGIDLSAEALKVATERLQRSCGEEGAARASFEQLSVFDVGSLPGEFDMINCVGVVHHTPDPPRAVRLLADKLRPGGILHIFVYALYGRWEIQLMQRALHILQRGEVNFDEGVRMARTLFKTLPASNRLRVREEQRWAQENQRDATFADMYLHPQEIDYTVDTIFELVDASGLEFVGFSNPQNFDLRRLLGDSPELLERATALPERERYRLVELLDPESVTHFEFFLAKPPLRRHDWEDEASLRSACGSIGECIHGWPGNFVFDRDYRPMDLSGAQQALMHALETNASMVAAMEQSGATVNEVRELVERGVLILSPGS